MGAAKYRLRNVVLPSVMGPNRCGYLHSYMVTPPAARSRGRPPPCHCAWPPPRPNTPGPQARGAVLGAGSSFPVTHRLDHSGEVLGFGVVENRAVLQQQAAVFGAAVEHFGDVLLHISGLG